MKLYGRSKYLLSVEAETVKGSVATPVKSVFVRNKNNRQDYFILVSTDLNLSEEEIITTYVKSCNIEIFLKMSQSRS